MQATTTLNKVYCIETDELPFPTIGLRPIFLPDGEQTVLSWENTMGRLHCIRVARFTDLTFPYGKEINVPRTFTATTNSDRKFTFIELTKDLWDEKFKNCVVGNLTFISDQQVQQFYLNADFCIY